MEAGDQHPVDTAQPAGSGKQSASDLKWFDFWILFSTEIAALIGLLVSITGFHVRAATRTIAFVVVSTPYAALTAAIAVAAARKAGFPILPIVEKWRRRVMGARDVANPMAAGLAGGTITFVAVWTYLPQLTKWLGSTPSKQHFTAHPIEIVCSAVLEEILFRLIVFGALAAALRWLWGLLGSRASSMPIWTANVLQALLFGAAHLAVDIGGLRGHPWYVRLPLIAQTWAGLVQGWLYWNYGIESAVVGHATYDLIVFRFVRRTTHRLRP